MPERVYVHSWAVECVNGRVCVRLWLTCCRLDQNSADDEGLSRCDDSYNYRRGCGVGRLCAEWRRVPAGDGRRVQWQARTPDGVQPLRAMRHVHLRDHGSGFGGRGDLNNGCALRLLSCTVCSDVLWSRRVARL